MTTIVMQQLLFGGEEVAKTLSSRLSQAQMFRASNHYRNARCLRWSYECCDTCRYIVRVKEAYKRNYYKCVWTGCSHGQSTDIRLGKVCDKWTKKGKSAAQPPSRKRC